MQGGSRCNLQGGDANGSTSLCYNRPVPKQPGERLRLQCPRCNTANSPDAHFCRMCGLPLSTQGISTTSFSGQLPPPMPSSDIPDIPAPSLLVPPSPTSASELPRYSQPPSVLFALGVGTPAKWQFWTGLALLMVVLACCPCSIGVLIFGSDAVANPSGFVAQILGIGACLLIGALVLGIILMRIGRPRRMQ